MGNGALRKCPAQRQSQLCCHRMALVAFLVVSWGQCHSDLSPSWLCMFLWSFPLLAHLWRDTHSCFGRDAHVLAVALGSDLRASTASLIPVFICIQGLGKVLRADFPLLQGHPEMSPQAFGAPVETQGIPEPFPLAFLQGGAV